MKTLLVLSLALTYSFSSHAQALTGVKTIPGDYATIAAAVTALNASGVGAGGVTFSVASGHTENTTTAIVLTATGTAANPIVFQKTGTGVNPQITRTNIGSVGTTTLGSDADGVVITEGVDFVTFNGIDIAASNSAIEYGYYLRKASGTDGSKNVTVQNATITMNKGTSAYVVGIYVSNNANGTSYTSANGVTVTSTDGCHENITLTGNTIRNVFAGIMIRGYNSTIFYDQNIIVGTSGAGNTIENFGGNTASNTYGIYATHQYNLNISYNTINNTAGGGNAHTAGIQGIFLSAGTTSSVSVSFNTVTLSSASAASVYHGISNSSFTGSATFNNNTISLSTTVASTGVFAHIYNNTATATIDISNNTFVGSTINTTGSTYFIYNNNASAGTMTIRGNTVSGSFNYTGTTNPIYCYFSAAVQGIEEISNNTFSNITITGSAEFRSIVSNAANTATQLVFNNTISNITGGNGQVHGINLSTAGTRTVYSNLIHSLSGSGIVTGIISGSGFAAGGIYKNKIYNLSTTGSGGTAIGISITSGTASVIYNNLIGNLTAPIANNTNAVQGISVSSTTANSAIQLYYNTIYLNASSTGTDFGTSGIFHTSNAAGTTAALDMRNNVIVNTSTAKGSGLIVAYRRDGTSLNNYTSTSNNNLFYAGSPSASNSIFYDGINVDQSLTSFQARVGSRESNSISVMPAFLSTTGIDATFLHLTPNTASPLAGAGSPITGFTSDFDGEARHTATPDIGADQFTVVPLPVSLVHFWGQQHGECNTLNWTTANESQNRGFFIERSTNGQQYTIIGFVNSLATDGNSHTSLHYNFSDKNPTGFKQYYRLRQVDLQGTTKWSHVIVLTSEAVKPLTMAALFPNPATNKVNLQVETLTAKHLLMVIFNASGNVVKQQPVFIEAGAHTIEIAIHTLPAGTYVLKLINQYSNQSCIRWFVKN